MFNLLSSAVSFAGEVIKNSVNQQLLFAVSFGIISTLAIMEFPIRKVIKKYDSKDPAIKMVWFLLYGIYILVCSFTLTLFLLILIHLIFADIPTAINQILNSNSTVDVNALSSR